MLKTIEIETAPQPGAAIIVLHGLGADGNDFVPICNEIDLSPVGPVRYVFPSAPEMPVTINGGYVMRSWYDIVGTQIDRQEDEAGLRKSALSVAALIAREIERGIPANRIVLMGFSQGCAMTLLTGLRYPERLAGLVALSGYLPLAAATAAERTDANALTPIFMGHGRSDGVVPMARAQFAQTSLKQLGYDIEWHDYPMAHSVCAEEVADLNRWLIKALG